MAFNKGDLLQATKRAKWQGLHYIIYYSGYNDDNFIGCMITSLNSNKNALLEPEYFMEHDERGVKYKLPYKTSYIVKAKLIKMENWGPFSIVGKLSQSGCEFVTELIEELHEETWEDYLKRTN